MLQHEGITKIQELKVKFKNVWLSSEYLNDHLNILGFNKIKSKYNLLKKSGYSFGSLISTLLVLPIVGLKSIHALTTAKDNELDTSGKDSYYRILANQKIKWRTFLFYFVKQYLLKDASFTAPEDDTKCMIFDDTDLSKSGKTIEGISKIYNHVSKSFFFGFKLLVAGYWNGSVFIPVDFSLHRECKKSKYGLTKKQRKAQKKTPRCDNTPAAKRYLIKRKQIF